MHAAPPSADPLPPMGLTWGIKRSFVEYITDLPDGTVTVSAGAAVSGSGHFSFPSAGSDYDVRTGTGVLRFRGDVRLAGHHGMLLFRLLDPWVEFSGGRGVLSIGTGAGQDRAELGFVQATAPREIGGFLIWEQADVLNSPAGAELFDGQYAAGQPMDPLSIRVPA